MSDIVVIKGKKIGEGQPKVCVPLVGRTEEQIQKQLDNIISMSKQTTIDMVEFRADYFDKLHDISAVKKILGSISARLEDIILLFTIRSESEGGEKLSFSTPTINEINSFVVENELADMVDVELFSGDDEIVRVLSLAKSRKVKIIMSNHDFNTTPDSTEMVARLTKMQDMGADIAKIAVMPQNQGHLLALLETLCRMKELNKTPVVGISMGQLGAISRITGEVFGSAMTFSALEKASAPGQIPVDEINDILDDIHRFCV